MSVPCARRHSPRKAAEKLYRALPGTAPVECAVSLTAGTNSWCEWLAQETILFNGARLRRSFRADLAPGVAYACRREHRFSGARRWARSYGQALPA